MHERAVLHPYLLVVAVERGTEAATGVAQAELRVGKAPRLRDDRKPKSVVTLAGLRISIGHRRERRPRREPALGGPVRQFGTLRNEVLPGAVAAARGSDNGTAVPVAGNGGVIGKERLGVVGGARGLEHPWHKTVAQYLGGLRGRVVRRD